MRAGFARSNSEETSRGTKPPLFAGGRGTVVNVGTITTQLCAAL